MTEIVYRVQNKNGEGYMKCKGKWQCCKDYTLENGTDRFINPFTDIIYGNRQLIFNKNFIIEQKLGNINLHYKEFNEIYKNDIEKLYDREFNFCICNDCKKPNLNLNINDNNVNNVNWNSDYNDSSSNYDSD